MQKLEKARKARLAANKMKMQEEEKIQAQNQDFLNSLAEDNASLKNVDSNEVRTGVRDHALKHAIVLINEYFHDLNDTLRSYEQKEQQDIPFVKDDLINI